MAHLYAKVRADGITAVPIYHNDKGRNGDGCRVLPGPGQQLPVRVWTATRQPAAPRRTGLHARAGPAGRQRQPGHPGVRAEFGGGFFDPWGGAPWQGQGYSFERAFDGPAYERQFYLTNVANGIKLQNVYMTFGGTSWGWLPASVVYTSYDYGAAISEARQLTAKIPAMKELGYFLRSVPDINKIDKASPVAASNSLLVTYHPGQPGHRHPVLLRPQRSHAGPDLHPRSARQAAPTPCRSPARCAGRQGPEGDRQDYQMDSAHLVYSTSHLMTHAPAAARTSRCWLCHPATTARRPATRPAAAGPQVSVRLRVRASALRA
jgi:hypothetical protein